MPTIVQQLRRDRRRRDRRRRAALSAVAVVPLALAGSRILSDAHGRAAELGAFAAVTSSEPTTTTAEPTTTTTTAPSGLQPGLARAFARAQAAASDAGEELTLTSGFRTAKKQAQLLEEEIDKRGDREEALWWVFPPATSMHVQGLAVDVGDRAAATWLLRNGSRFGLCHTLSWEWWHFEWRQRWEDTGHCPAEARTPADAPGVDGEPLEP